MQHSQIIFYLMVSQVNLSQTVHTLGISFDNTLCMELQPFKTQKLCNIIARAVARALIGGGGGVYSYIRVTPDEFLLKSVVFKLISKEISRAEHEYMNIHPPPPQLTL